MSEQIRMHCGYNPVRRQIEYTLQGGDGQPASKWTTPLSKFLTDLQINENEIQDAVNEARLRPGGPGALRMFDPKLDGIRSLAIPSDLTGKTVLDIGGYDGSFARVCLDRGAKSAICFDSEEWRDYCWSPPHRFPGVVYERGSLMDFAWRAPRPADFVIFYNVIYHVRDPWTALERVRLLTRETMAICTSYVPGEDYTWRLHTLEDPEASMENDRFTIFWKPTVNGLLRLLKATGFNDNQEIGRNGDHIVLRCR